MSTSTANYAVDELPQEWHEGYFCGRENGEVPTLEAIAIRIIVFRRAARAVSELVVQAKRSEPPHFMRGSCA
jgi:hypothetical protein